MSPAFMSLGLTMAFVAGVVLAIQDAATRTLSLRLQCLALLASVVVNPASYWHGMPGAAVLASSYAFGPMLWGRAAFGLGDSVAALWLGMWFTSTEAIFAVAAACAFQWTLRSIWTAAAGVVPLRLPFFPSLLLSHTVFFLSLRHHHHP